MTTACASGQSALRAHAALRLRLQPGHGAVLAFGDELPETRRGLGNRIRTGDADKFETLGAGVGDQPALERGRVRRAGLFQGVGLARLHGAE